MTFRKTIFWLHLACGLIAGLVIGIMSFTGAALAFEKEIIAWVERDAARVTLPALGTPRLSIDELVRRVRTAQPNAQPASVIVKTDPAAAIAMSVGTSTIYVNPYTGEIRRSGAEKTRAFMRVMNAWHRTIALTADNRALGKAITGACNVAFLVLAVTGLYIWMPRKWSRQALRPSVWFVGGAQGKSRDWNWHNVIGLWSAPIFIVLTATALPISYLWAGNLINRLNGPETTAAGAGTNAASPPTSPLPASAVGTTRLDLDPLLVAAQQQMPDWKQITLRLPGGGGGRGGERGAVQPVSFSIREAHSWPRTATTMLTLDPFTGSALSRAGYAELAVGRQVRAWTRFLHTGEALGPAGQFFAGLASLGACVLVWTGFALAWRRFFGQRVKSPSTPVVSSSGE